MERFNYTQDNSAELIYDMNVEHMDEDEAAQLWVDENQDTVEAWISGYEA